MEVFSQWHDVLAGVLGQTLERLALYLPNVLGAFLLLFFGWIVAHALRATAVRLTQLGERALVRLVPGRATAPKQFSSASAKVLGSVIFWVVMLFFLAAATQVLGLHTFTAWIARVVDYLPTVFAGLLIIVAGFLVSRLVRDVVEAAAAGAGERQRQLMGRVVQAVILVTAILVGAEQIGIKVTFLVILAAAAGIALVGAVALALSLGAREYVANLIGGHYLRQRYSVGQHILVTGHEGRILELTDTTVVLETAAGRTSLPAKVFNEQAIVLLVSEARND
ncbi:MAG: mechanosensitive ion channel [Gammaproteobacteria bacterium]|nr:mechanosensitive ion channel [Gammaproteobacteria bacterium]MBU1645296.1 mechanosensitive ion channel [Gammaproteobacteria bacterium]MBU1972289.1 mechanosensitive ion channel [Gammaproteobacteria bacterium]